MLEPLNRSVTFHIPMLLSPPLAHPDPDNSPSVSLCFCGSSASVHLSPNSLLSSFCLYSSLFFLYFSLSSCFVQCFCSSWCFQSIPSPRSFYTSTITHPPVRSIYLCVAESFSSHRTPQYATVMESSPPLSFLLSFTGSSSLELSLRELLLTFCLPTRFKFN